MCNSKYSLPLPSPSFFRLTALSSVAIPQSGMPPSSALSYKKMTGESNDSEYSEVHYV